MNGKKEEKMRREKNMVSRYEELENIRKILLPFNQLSKIILQPALFYEPFLHLSLFHRHNTLTLSLFPSLFPLYFSLHPWLNSDPSYPHLNSKVNSYKVIPNFRKNQKKNTRTRQFLSARINATERWKNRSIHPHPLLLRKLRRRRMRRGQMIFTCVFARLICRCPPFKMDQSNSRQ